MRTLFGDAPDHYARLRRSAELSDCGRYRWWLRRHWQAGGNGKVVCLVMLNPSTADAETDDPTVRRCMRYAQAWGYSTLSIRNLFCLRATDPRQLMTTADPVGPRGDVELLAARTADMVVCAWGTDGHLFGRGRRALELLAARPLHCLGTNKDGTPKHPLYLRADAVPVPFGG